MNTQARDSSNEGRGSSVDRHAASGRDTPRKEGPR